MIPENQVIPEKIFFSKEEVVKLKQWIRTIKTINKKSNKKITFCFDTIQVLSKYFHRSYIIEEEYYENLNLRLFAVDAISNNETMFFVNFYENNIACIWLENDNLIAKYKTKEINKISWKDACLWMEKMVNHEIKIP